MHSLAHPQLMRTLFKMVDKDNSGTISLSELYELLQNKQFGSTKEASKSSKAFVESIMQSLDESGDGTLDFEEFCHAFESILDPEDDVSCMHTYVCVFVCVHLFLTSFQVQV